MPLVDDLEIRSSITTWQGSRRVKRFGRPPHAASRRHGSVTSGTMNGNRDKRLLIDFWSAVTN
jgi:hypothetical protein